MQTRPRSRLHRTTSATFPLADFDFDWLTLALDDELRLVARLLL